MVSLGRARAAVPSPPTPSRRRAVAAVCPGLVAAAVLAAAATVTGGVVPIVGAPVIAIVGGMAVAAARPSPPSWRPGLAFTSRKVLQAAIVVLGLGLSFREVVATNERSLPVLVGTLAVALTAARLVGRRLRLPGDVTTLVGVGTAICGASAIAATNAVIEADQADVGYAVATIFTFNVAAVLTFPSIGHALGLSQRAFGLWAGTAVNDVSSVAAAATVYGHAATSDAVVVKLTRTLAIVPITAALAVWRHRHRGKLEAAPPGDRPRPVDRAAGGDTTTGTQRPPLWRVFPLFLLGFAGAVGVNSLGVVPSGWHAGLATLSTWLITAALGAIGLSTDFGRLRRAGGRPLALGAVLWAVVALTSLGLQVATGTL